MKNSKLLLSFFALILAVGLGNQANAQSTATKVQLKHQPSKRNLSPTAAPVSQEVKTAPVETRSSHMMKPAKTERHVRTLYNSRTRQYVKRDVAGKKQTMESRSAK